MSFLSGLFFFLPIFVLFFMDNGLNLTQILFLQAFFAITVVLLEVPTGFIADVQGRKKSLILSSIAILIAISAYSLGHNFMHFLVAEALWALGVSLLSGADSAFLYDTLKALKREKEYKKAEGHAFFLTTMAVAVSAIIGGYLGSIDLRYPFYAMFPVFFSVFLINLTLMEPKHYKEVCNDNYVRRLSKTFRFVFVKSKELRWLIVYYAVIIGFGGVAFWFYQPYFMETGLDIVYFGAIFAGMGIVSAFSAKYAYWIEFRIGKKISLVFLMIFTAIPLLLMYKFAFAASAMFVFISSFAYGFERPLINDYIHQIVWSDKRATVLSIKNLSGRLMFAIVSPFFGYFADVYTIQQAFLLLAIIVLVLGGILLLILKKDKVI